MVCSYRLLSYFTLILGVYGRSGNTFQIDVITNPSPSDDIEAIGGTKVTLPDDVFQAIVSTSSPETMYRVNFMSEFARDAKRLAFCWRPGVADGATWIPGFTQEVYFLEFSDDYSTNTATLVHSSPAVCEGNR